jgi:hypothetical protein
MHLKYGLVKCKLGSNPVLKSSRHKKEIQYHLHTVLLVKATHGTEHWDSAINVGTNDADDQLRYRLAFDYQGHLVGLLKATPAGFTDLTGKSALPALDFLRSDCLAATGHWRDSDVMDGSDSPEPVASLKKLLTKAHTANADVYIFGRTYTDGSAGIHDVHMNQGSSGSFVNDGTDNHNDHNDVWQDGAVIVDFGEPECVAYFTAFTQQSVPTDRLGNAGHPSHEIGDADPGSLA